MTNELVEHKKKNIWKIGRKNLVIILSVLLIGGAVALNWVLFSNPAEPADPNTPTVNQPSNDQNTGSQTQESDYFAQMALERQKARDEAMEVLQTVVDSPDALQEAKDAAYTKINEIADIIQSEANIETLIMAKGFEDCVAVINDSKASIIVKTEGLLENQVAQIQEIVYQQSGILPKNIQIIEKDLKKGTAKQSLFYPNIFARRVLV